MFSVFITWIKWDVWVQLQVFIHTFAECRILHTCDMTCHTWWSEKDRFLHLFPTNIPFTTSYNCRKSLLLPYTTKLTHFGRWLAWKSRYFSTRRQRDVPTQIKTSKCENCDQLFRLVRNKKIINGIYNFKKNNILVALLYNNILYIKHIFNNINYNKNWI